MNCLNIKAPTTAAILSELQEQEDCFTEKDERFVREAVEQLMFIQALKTTTESLNVEVIKLSQDIIYQA